MATDFATINRFRKLEQKMFHVKVEDMKVDLEPGECGKWLLEKFEISPETSEGTKLTAVQNFGRGFVPAGEYTRLKDKTIDSPWFSGTWMSDTPDECLDHIGFLTPAKGRVLIGGLGIGVAINSLMMNPAVEHVTVLEIDEDVIELVGEQYRSRYGAERLKIIHADVFKWKPDMKEFQMFDSCWMDIWITLCADNLTEMKKLSRRYKKCCRKIGFWSYFELLRLKEIGY